MTIHATDRHAAAAAGGTPPFEPPAGPSDRGTGGFGSSRARLALLLLMLLISALGVPAGIAAFIYGIMNRPLTAGVPLLVLLLLVYRHSRLYLAEPRRIGRMIYGGIAGGVIGEALTYAIWSLPPDAPRSAPWVALFAVAIGGAIGLLLALAGLLALSGLLAASLIPATARAVFRRAA